MRALMIITSAVVVIALTGVYFFNRSNSRLITSIRDTRAKSEQVAQTSAKISAAKKQLATNSEAEKKLASKLITEKELDSFFSTLSDLASRHQVTQTLSVGQTGTSATQTPTTTPPPSGELPFSLVITGQNEAAIIGFLSDLEKSLYVITIKSTTITSGSDSTALPSGQGSTSAPARGVVDFILYVEKSN